MKYLTMAVLPSLVIIVFVSNKTAFILLRLTGVAVGARSHQQAGDSELAAYIYINGAERGQSDAFVKGPVNETGYVIVQDVYSLNAGNIVTMHVRHKAGGARNTQTGLGGRPRMSVVQLR